MTMQRGGNLVGPRADEEMKHQLEGYLRSGHPTHADEARDPEPPADDDIRVSSRGPVPPPGEELERAAAAEEARFLRVELARFLDSKTFPADRSGLVRALEEHHAPAAALDAARNLPEGGTYTNVEDVVRALGLGPPA